jgi:hypothetical protein
VSSKCFQLYCTCSDRLLTIALPSYSFHIFSILTVTFPKLSVILRPLYMTIGCIPAICNVCKLCKREQGICAEFFRWISHRQILNRDPVYLSQYGV